MAEPSRRPHRDHMLTTIGLMVLVGVEVFAVALSGGWAIAGLLELGDYVAYALMAAFSCVALWLLIQLWHKTLSVDPNG